MSTRSIVVLAPSYPFPARGGIELRVHSVMERLAACYTLDLICFDDVDHPHEDALTEGWPGRVTRLPYPGVSGTSGLPQFLNPTPTLLRRFQSESMRRALGERDWSAVAAVHVETLQLAPYLDLVPPDVPTMFFNDNIESRIIARLAETRSGLRRLYWRWEAAKLARAEWRLLQQGDVVAAVSEVDAEEFRRHTSPDRVRVVPLLLDLSAFRERGAEAPATPPRLTFVGSFNWHVNEAAAEWLVGEVWPLIVAAVPEARLYLVGRNPSALVQSLGEREEVVVTGTVEDVSEHVALSSVMLVPLQYGSGVRSKILEAWAARRPVVSTAVGCEGLPVVHGENLWVADTSGEFAAACIDLLKDPARGRAVAERGYDQCLGLEREAEESFRAAYAAIGIEL